MNRQVQYVNLIPAFENASGIFPFQGGVDTDYKYKAWNVLINWDPEFFGNPTDEALSGKKRSNFRGYRMKATLSLDNTTQASGIRTLFNKFSGGYDRVVWTTQFNATAAGVSSSVLKDPAPSVNNWLIGTTASGFSGAVTKVVNNYIASTKTIYIDNTPNSDTTANDLVTFYAKPNIETIVLFDPTGGATTYSGVNVIACNVMTNMYGVSREFTINQQRVSLELESVELYKEIPSVYDVT